MVGWKQVITLYSFLYFFFYILISKWSFFSKGGARWTTLVSLVFFLNRFEGEKAFFFLFDSRKKGSAWNGFCSKALHLALNGIAKRNGMGAIDYLVLDFPIFFWFVKWSTCVFLFWMIFDRWNDAIDLLSSTVKKSYALSSLFSSVLFLRVIVYIIVDSN